jgi:hypothetical protein
MLLFLLANIASAQNEVDRLLDLSLEELQEVEVTAGTLVATTERLKPAAVTRIGAREMRQSGARHLNELFDIYVPNLQLMRHEFEQTQIGTRAIFAAYGDKHLLLVNGRLMNHVSKLAVTYDLSDTCTASPSLRVYWGFDGAKDIAQYHNDRLAATGSRVGFLSLADPGYEQAFKPTYYLNLGLEYRPPPRLTGRLDGYIRLAGLEMHPLDTEDRIPAIKDEYGSGMCNITRCCTEVCPEHINITDNGIIPLKERVVDRYYDPLMKVWRAIFGSKK